MQREFEVRRFCIYRRRERERERDHMQSEKGKACVCFVPVRFSGIPAIICYDFYCIFCRAALWAPPYKRRMNVSFIYSTRLDSHSSSDRISVLSFLSTRSSPLLQRFNGLNFYSYSVFTSFLMDESLHILWEIYVRALKSRSFWHKVLHLMGYKV